MKRAGKFSRTQTDLVTGLRTLRMVVKEVGYNYVAGLQSDVAHLEQTVQLLRDGDALDRKQLNQMVTMLKWLNTLEVKPQKGRRRDLKALDRLIRKMAGLADTW